MKISELQLSNLVKHFLVLEFKNRGVAGLCINEYLPLCAALLYPYIHYEIIVGNNKQGSIIPILKSIKTFSKNKRLDKYDMESLRAFFQKKWLPTLSPELQRNFISGISLISEIEDNGFFSIKGNDIVHNSYLQIDIIDISNNYGNENYETSDVIIETDGHETTNEDEEIEAPSLAVTDGHHELVSLNPLKEFLLTNISLNQFPKGLRQYNYFWEFRFNNDQYNKLKEVLTNLDLANHIELLRQEINGYGTVALSVALYVAEWYKRECDSLDGDKCLESIGLGSRHSSNIWKKSGLPEEFLHQNENRNQMRQIAMCALGGLPIKYVTNSNRFKDFINNLAAINPEAETTDEDIEKIVDCFDDNNGVFKRSLTSGSCKEYLLELVAYLESEDKLFLPFSKTDSELPLFSKFLRQLQEGFDDELPKKFFKSEIRVWTYDFIEEGDDSQNIETDFHVHIGSGKNENRNVITVKELSKLGVNLPHGANAFDICLKFIQNDGTSIMSEEKRTYFRIGNNCNDFCGAYGSDITTSINLFDVREISLLIVCGEYQKVIHQYPVPQYLELYSTDVFYLWTTKTNNAARKVLFYNTSEYKNVDELEICYKSKNKDNEETSNEWGWIYQKEIINLLDNDGEMIEVPLRGSDSIIVDFRTKGLRKNFALTSDDCVPCVIDGESEEPVHLLYYSKGQELLMECDGLKGRELLDNYKLEFKYLHDNRYSEWTNNCYPSQGFIKLRISCRDISKKKRIWIGVVYFIPKTNIIRRNIRDHYISFEGSNVFPIDNSLLDSFNPKKNKFKDSPDHGLHSSTISFRIGNNENHVIVDVYRAFKWQQIWNKDKKIKDVIEGNILPVAIILQKNIRIKGVDENGYNEYTPNFCEYINYFNDPKKITFYENTNIHTCRIYRGLIAQPLITCQSYVYLSRYEDTSQSIEKVRKIEKYNDFILLYVSNKHINEYEFYYWSGKMEDEPIKLKCEKLEDKKYQYYIPSPLTEKAIVFQSIRNCSPNMYFRPFYDDKWSWDYYINRYNNVSIDYLLKCYGYAVEHNIYFCIFPALRRLQERDFFTKFIRTYIHKNNYRLSKKDLKDLTRLAIELGMDCFFVNRTILFSNLDEECMQNMRDCMKKLLLCSPIERGEHAYSKRFIDRFLLDNNAFNQRKGKLPRQFLKVIDNFNSYDGCDNIENRIAFLTKLVNSEDNIFKELCRILNI